MRTYAYHLEEKKNMSSTTKELPTLHQRYHVKGHNDILFLRVSGKKPTKIPLYNKNMLRDEVSLHRGAKKKKKNTNNRALIDNFYTTDILDPSTNSICKEYSIDDLTVILCFHLFPQF